MLAGSGGCRGSAAAKAAGFVPQQGKCSVAAQCPSSTRAGGRATRCRILQHPWGGARALLPPAAPAAGSAARHPGAAGVRVGGVGAGLAAPVCRQHPPAGGHRALRQADGGHRRCGVAFRRRGCGGTRASSSTTTFSSNSSSSRSASATTSDTRGAISRLHSACARQCTENCLAGGSRLATPYDRRGRARLLRMCMPFACRQGKCYLPLSLSHFCKVLCCAVLWCAHAVQARCCTSRDMRSTR